MKRMCVVAVLVGLLGLPVQANLVSNGDFETGDLTGWWAWSPDETTQSIAVQNVTVHDGDYSVEMISATDGAWQEMGTNAFGIDADTPYTLSLVYNETGWVGAGINLKYWDAGWAEVGSQQWIDLVSSGAEGTGEWTVFSSDFTTAAGAVYMEVKIAQGGWGTLSLDNVSVVPEPATLALLAMGSTLMMKRRRE